MSNTGPGYIIKASASVDMLITWQYQSTVVNHIPCLLTLASTVLPLCKENKPNSVKGKGKGLDTCYSATYMSQTRDQQRFTVLHIIKATCFTPTRHVHSDICLYWYVLL